MIEAWAARILCLVASIVIAGLAEQRLNLMSPCARPGFRLAFLGLTVGAVWQTIDMLSGAVPSWPVVVVSIGLSLLLLEERHCPRTCQRSGEAKAITRHRRRHDGPSVTDPPGV